MESVSNPASWDRDELRRRLQSMDNYDFEHFIAELWERQGWDAEVEQQSGDAGVDIRATKSSPYEQKVLIQAKRYAEGNTVGGPEVQQYSALKQQETGVDKAILVTTSQFTASAEDRAADLNVKLIDGDGLIDLLEESDAYDIVAEYLRPTAATSARGRSSSQAEIADRQQHLTPAEREQLEELLGEDYEDELEEQRYNTTRAFERAKTKTKLNPHDAAELGVFDGIEEIDPERKFNDVKGLLPFGKDDLHLDSDEKLFVGDLTDYVPASAIDTEHSEGVIGIIERGVRDEAWAADGALAQQHIKNAKQSDSATTGVTDRLSSIAEGHENLHYVALGGLALTMLGFALIPSDPNTPVTVFDGIGALLVFTMPFIGLAGLALDLAYINSEDTDWNPSILLGLIGAVVLSIFYATYYVYKRWDHLGL